MNAGTHQINEASGGSMKVTVYIQLRGGSATPYLGGEEVLVVAALVVVGNLNR